MVVSLLRVMPRPTHAARASQVLQTLLLQGAARLDEETSIDRLVWHATALVVRIDLFEPPGDLFR